MVEGDKHRSIGTRDAQRYKNSLHRGSFRWGSHKVTDPAFVGFILGMVDPSGR